MNLIFYPLNMFVHNINFVQWMKNKAITTCCKCLVAIDNYSSTQWAKVAVTFWCQPNFNGSWLCSVARFCMLVIVSFVNKTGHVGYTVYVVYFIFRLFFRYCVSWSTVYCTVYVNDFARNVIGILSLVYVY